jgi:Tfp pilus assembly protein PilF
MLLNEHQKKAQKLLDDHKLEQSLNEFTLALEEEPNNAEIYNQRAVVYIHLNKKHLSLTDFNKAVELDPKYAYRYASRAYAKDYFGDIEGAIEDYKKAVSLDPEDAVANNNLGILLEKRVTKKKRKIITKRQIKFPKLKKNLIKQCSKRRCSFV